MQVYSSAPQLKVFFCLDVQIQQILDQGQL